MNGRKYVSRGGGAGRDPEGYTIEDFIKMHNESISGGTIQWAINLDMRVAALKRRWGERFSGSYCSIP